MLVIAGGVTSDLQAKVVNHTLQEVPQVVCKQRL